MTREEDYQFAANDADKSNKIRIEKRYLDLGSEVADDYTGSHLNTRLGLV